MKKFIMVFSLLLFFSSTTPLLSIASTTDLWVGNDFFDISRAADSPCQRPSGVLSDKIKFNSWVRFRAITKHICFEVYAKNITDNYNPNYWKELNVEIHFRFSEDSDFRSEYVKAIGFKNNNLLYAWSLSLTDIFTYPYTSIGLPNLPKEVPVYIDQDDSDQSYAKMEYYFTVNGITLRNKDDKPFIIRYYK